MTKKRFLPYQLTLRAPALVTALSGDPNSAATQPFIPGGAIRGAVAGRLLAQHVDPDSEDFRRLILSGDVCYLHAYPEVNETRALPLPQSWRGIKNNPGMVRDLAAWTGDVEGPPDAPEASWPPEALTGPPGPFVAPAAGPRIVATPRMDARLHQQRDRVRGRPGPEGTQGTIFAYEFLQANQDFRGVIAFSDTALDKGEDGRLRDLLRKPILVGRSRRAGYGGEAVLTFGELQSAEYENLADGLHSDVKKDQALRLLFVSAYIGRHPETGQVDPSAVDHELARRLEGLALRGRRWSFEVVGGFNRKWRLELPQSLAVSAGSVLMLEAERDIELNELRDLEQTSLGERRAEGFGRIAFLRAADEACLTVKPYEFPSAAAQISPSSSEDSLSFLEERILLSAVRKELDRVAAEKASTAQKLPTNSLIGRLRNRLRSVSDETTAKEALNDLATWLGQGDDAFKEPAMKQLEGCKIGGSTLRPWLVDLLRSALETETNSDNNPSFDWNGLFAPLTQSHRLTTEEAAHAVLKSHRCRLCVALIDGVLAALACRNRGGHDA